MDETLNLNTLLSINLAFESFHYNNSYLHYKLSVSLFLNILKKHKFAFLLLTFIKIGTIIVRYLTKWRHYECTL